MTLLVPAGATAQTSNLQAVGRDLKTSESSPQTDATSTQSTRSEQGPFTPLSIDQAIALAEQNSPLLKQGEAVVQRSNAGIHSARAYPNPVAEVLAGNQSARPIATPGVPGVLQHYSVGQTIEIPSERRTRIQGAQLDLKASQYLLDETRLGVAASVRRAFYNILRRKEQIAYAKDNLALVDDLRRRVSLEFQTGEKGKLELTRAEAELARARYALNSANVQLSNARAVLKAVLGASTDENYDPQGSAVGAVQLPGLEEMRQKILTLHPALAEAQTRTAQAQSFVENERARRIPQPTFFGEWERQPDITFYRAGVSVAIPLWDRRKGPIAEAQAEVSRSTSVVRQRQLELMASLESAYDQYQISDEQVKALEAGSMREAEAAVDAARAAYKFGERGIVEVLDAQRVLQAVRNDLLDAVFTRQNALIDLEELGAAQ